MRNSKQKIGIMVALLFIVIGFAALTTVLVINGTVNISSSKETFDDDVIFTKAETNRGGIAYISSDGKSITYSTNDLSELGQESTLDFSITNKSRIYDADAVIECVTIDETNLYNDYINFSVDPDEFNIPASETKDGILKISLVKSYSGDGAEIQFKCTINANAIERDTTADEIVINPSETNVVSGYIFDDNNMPLANANIVIMADSLYYATTDENGYYEISGLSNGSYPIYIMNSELSLEEIKEMSSQEVKENSIAKAQINTSNMDVTFDNNYKQVSNETVTKYTITFDANGGSVEETAREIVENASIGELPTPTRTGYTFNGWFTDASEVTQISSTTRVTENQTLYAQWTVKSYYIVLWTKGYCTPEYNNTYNISKRLQITYGDSINDYSYYAYMDQVGYPVSKGNITISCTNGYKSSVSVKDTYYLTINIDNDNNDADSVCSITCAS